MIRTVAGDRLDQRRPAAPLARASVRPRASGCVADRQTAGRGRQGRAWLDGAGNLHGLDAWCGSRAGRSARRRRWRWSPALALDEAVARLSARRRAALPLKWPNDLLVGGAKLAGILLERAGDAVVDRHRRQPRAPSRRARPPRRPASPAHGAARRPRRLRRNARRSLRPLSSRAGAARASRPVRARWLARAHPVGTALTVAAAGRTTRRRACSTGSTPMARSCCAWRTARGRVIHAGDVFLLLKDQLMLLAIDVGNTNVVFALFDGPRDQGALAHRHRSAPHRRRICGLAAASCWRSKAIERDDGRPASSSPRSCRARCTTSRCWREKYFKADAADRGRGAATGAIAIDVDEPRSLGADRAVNAIAAHARTRAT